MDRKKIYNPFSDETLTDRKVFGGNPQGILNFTKAKYQWALKLWDLMEANTWFPKEVDTTDDVRDYNFNLTSAEKRMYDLVWSQLISMDSFQTNNLADNINPYITAPEINAVLARQAYEEANHSKSYAVMVEAICENTDLIYEMFETAGNLEIDWGKYITDNQIMGFTDDIIEEYIHYLVDQRLLAIGLEKRYGAKHPIKWVDDFSKFNDQKSNFFESKVTNYSKGSLSFDDF